MYIKKQWSSGTGEVTIVYNGSGNGEMTISSDGNNLYEQRSMDIVVSTTAGSPTVTKTITIAQAARVRTDISNAVVTAPNQTYSGSAKTPTPTVVLNGTTIPSTGYDVTYSNNTNAGTATVTITGKGDYTGTASGTFSIAKANPIYVAPTANNRTYDTTSKALLVAGSNTTPGTFTYCSTQSGTYSSTIPSQTNAGSYTTYWKFTPTDTNNYNSVAATAISTTVSAKTVSSPTITLSQSTYTYSGNACQPTPTVKDGTVTISSSEYTVSYSNNINAGTGTVTITDKSGGNYAVSGSKTFTINKADPTYTAPSATNPTYSGSSQYLTTAGSTSHGTIYFSTDGSTWGTTRKSGTTAGSYNVYWKLTGDNNHNDVTSTKISNVTITQKALTITAKAQTITYGGSIATGTSQVTTSGLVSGDSLTSVTLTASTSQVTTSGTITPSAAATSKGISNYSVTYNNGNLTINKANSSVTSAPTAKTLIYSGSAQSLVNAGSASGGTMYYKMTTTNSKPSSTSGFSSAIPTATNAGKYYVWYYVKGDSNHNDTDISSTSVTVDIMSIVASYNRDNYSLDPLSENGGQWVAMSQPRYYCAFIDVSYFVGSTAIITHPGAVLLMTHYPTIGETFSTSYTARYYAPSNKQITIPSGTKYICVMNPMNSTATSTVNIASAKTKVVLATYGESDFVRDFNNPNGHYLVIDGNPSKWDYRNNNSYASGYIDVSSFAGKMAHIKYYLSGGTPTCIFMDHIPDEQETYAGSYIINYINTNGYDVPVPSSAKYMILLHLNNQINAGAVVDINFYKCE